MTVAGDRHSEAFTSGDGPILSSVWDRGHVDCVEPLEGAIATGTAILTDTEHQHPSGGAHSNTEGSFDFTCTNSVDDGLTWGSTLV